MSYLVSIVIRGSLKDKKTGDPLSNREITLEYNGNTYIITTREDGSFEIGDAVPPKIYIVKAVFKGDRNHKPVSRAISLDARVPTYVFIDWYGWYENGAFYITIYGWLYDFYGAPVVLKKIHVVLGTKYIETLTDEGGEFHALFIIPAGKYYAKAWFDGDEAYKGSVSDTVLVDTEQIPI